MNADTSAVGRAVGRYEILHQIGQGAMGTVHLARQIDLDRFVALKELDRLEGGEPGVFAARFLREARLAGSLSHANIVTVHEYFEHGGRPYIAMEYAEGGSLREHLDGLSMSQIVGVLAGLLSALTHAEGRGIVHRDIKPENVLVSADGVVKVADFGIAKAYTLTGGPMLTGTGATVGSPLYMAPEQATGQPVSAATDLYAVGIVGFEMLFGYVPFGSGQAPLAILWQHVHEPVPDARALRPDLDARLCGWLERLLAKDAADRPASAAAALDALEEIALELLGSRWRREASLLPWPSPSRVPARPAGGHVAPALDAGATRDAGDPAVMPDAPIHEPAHDAGSTEARPSHRAPAAPSRARRSVRRPAAIGAVALLLAGGGYLMFAREAAPPRPAAASSPPAAAAVAEVASASVAAAAAAESRFVTDLENALQRLETTRVRARRRLVAADAAREQAEQADVVTAAYRKASGAVADLAPAPARADAVERLRTALDRSSQAYAALANAALARRAAPYDAARDAVAAREDAVRRAYEAIDGAGGSPLAAARPLPPLGAGGRSTTLPTPRVVTPRPRQNVAPPPPRPAPRPSSPRTETAKPLS